MAESDASASASAELIEAEHRSPKAEPFLERIASLFGGGGGATGGGATEGGGARLGGSTPE